MTTWMKKVFDAEGVTEHPPGPHLTAVSDRFRRSGAIILLLDVSSSMGGDPLASAVRGCSGFIDDAIAGGYQVGLLLWSHEVVGFEPPTRDGAAARAMLKRARAGGGTYILPSLTLAGDHLLGLDVSDRVIAVFGDGDLGNAFEASQCASALAERGVRILTLGLGAASAEALSVISTEQGIGPRSTTSAAMATDIRGLASGLAVRRRPR
jgi:Mg-chelatase subunit ChlD